MRRKGSEDVFDAPVTPASMASAGEMTVIGVGARLDGNLISAASLRIEGRVAGQVNAEGDVIVAPEAEVEADIKATNVTVAGICRGNVTASGRLELASTARVEGNLSCGSLVVAEGAFFAGQSIMEAPGASFSHETFADSIEE
jgi:cytoskeletal protein CcmA (bactofilin family)